MKSINSKNAFAKTPLVSEEWKRKSNLERIALVENFFKKNQYIDYKVVRVEIDGHVILKVEKNIPAHERGLLFLNLEQKMKDQIDKGITIWLEPVGDKSKLRNLRGINIKSL